MNAPDTSGTILLLGRVPELSGPLISALSAERYRVRSIELASTTGPIDSRRFGIRLNSGEDVDALIAYLREQDGEHSISAVVSLLGVGPADGNATEQLFLLMQKLQNEFRPAQDSSTLLLLNVLELDGRLGMTGTRDLDDDRTGTVGFCKSLGREFGECHVLNLDLSPILPVAGKVASIFDSILRPSGLAEVGIDSEGRWTVALKPVDSKSLESTSDPICGPDSVIMVTGGGDGVTAYVTRQLAAQSPTLVVIGRTPLPGPSETSYLGMDEKSLRARLIQEQANQKFVPSEIEQRVRRYLKQGRLVSNLSKFRELGAKVDYICADVANDAEFSAVINDVYARYGRIDGVMHGAGVIRDKLVGDKTLESFRLVYSTKVDSARTLARTLRPECLKFLVFFSSVASRFGNYGQTDYSAANEFLNKLSNRLNQQWPARVVAIQWGPWDGGMVDDFIRNVFERHEIHMIPLQTGAESLGAELRLQKQPGGEVLISRSVDKISTL